MGLKEDTSLTQEDIKKGILKYFKEHGKAPKQKSGDASKYFGFQIAWATIQKRLLHQESSLFKLCVEMGLKKKGKLS